MPKPLSPIATEEAPFDVPDQWEWVRLGDIANSRLGKMLDKSKNKGPYRRYLRNANVQWFRFDLSDVLELRLENADLEEYSVKENDLIVCEGGEPGRAAVCGPECGWNGLSEGSASCPSLVRYQHLVSCISPSLRHVVTAHQHPLHRSYHQAFDW